MRFRACAGRGCRRCADGHGQSSGELEWPLQRTSVLSNCLYLAASATPLTMDPNDAVEAEAVFGHFLFVLRQFDVAGIFPRPGIRGMGER